MANPDDTAPVSTDQGDPPTSSSASASPQSLTYPKITYRSLMSTELSQGSIRAALDALPTPPPAEPLSSPHFSPVPHSPVLKPAGVSPLPASPAPPPPVLKPKPIKPGAASLPSAPHFPTHAPPSFSVTPTNVSLSAASPFSEPATRPPATTPPPPLTLSSRAAPAPPHRMIERVTDIALTSAASPTSAPSPSAPTSAHDPPSRASTMEPLRTSAAGPFRTSTAEPSRASPTEPASSSPPPPPPPPANSPAARLAAQRLARLRVKPLALARLFVARPRQICVLAALLPLFGAGLTAALGALRFADPTFRDYLIRNAGTVLVDDARTAARNANALRDFDQFVDDGVAGGGSTAVRGTVSDANRMAFLWRVGDAVAEAADAAQGQNLLTRENVAAMKGVEDAFVGAEGYAHFCWYNVDGAICDGEKQPPACAVRESLTAHPRLYGVVNSAGQICDVRKGNAVVSEAAFANFLDEIVRDGTGGESKRVIDRSVAGVIGKDANQTSGAPQTFIARSIFNMGLPFEGFKDEEDDKAEQSAKFLAFLDQTVPEAEALEALDAKEKGGLNMLATGIFFANSKFSDQATTDLSFAVVAIGLVLLFMWIHMRSLFLAAVAMLQVILAFPAAYLIYRFMAQIKYFSALNVMTIFLILGVAADDAFVFTDAWSQAAVVLGPRCDLVRRLSWTYRRSAKAMAVTSFTTALAFAFTAVSPVMPVATLGYWASFLVLVQYLLVITMFPCAVIMWHRSIRHRKLKNCFTKAGDADELDDCLITVEDDESYCAPNSGSSRSTAATAATDDQTAEDVRFGVADVTEDDEATSVIEAPVAKWASWKRCFRGNNGGGKSSSEYRRVEKFFRYRWVVYIDKLKYVLVVAALAVFGVSIYFAAKLEPLSADEEFLPPDAPLRIATRLNRNAFLDFSGRSSVQSTVFWGVQGVDREGTSKYDPESVGSPIYDDSFDLKPADTQDFMLKVCNDIAKNSDLLSQTRQNDPVNCWIRDFSAWRSSPFQTYKDDASLVVELRSFFGFTNETDGSQPYMQYLRDGRLIFSPKGDRVVFTEFVFDTDIRITEPGRVVRPRFDNWQSAVEKLARSAPKSAKEPLVSFGYASMWMVTTETLIRNAFRGVGIMVGVAFCVLALSTANIVVALITTVAIGGIVTNLFAIIFLLGYEMGLTESIGVIIGAGVSFDFCSHMANAYVESKSATRHERVRDALTDLGISVVAGALSTMASGATLFLAKITFFRKFARFVVFTVGLSLVWSLVFLMAFFLLLGPEGDFGSLKPLFRKLAPCWRKKSSENGDMEELSK